MYYLMCVLCLDMYLYTMYYYSRHPMYNFHNLYSWLVLLPNQILRLFDIGYRLDMYLHLIQNIHSYLDWLPHIYMSYLELNLLNLMYDNIIHLLLVMYIILWYNLLVILYHLFEHLNYIHLNLFHWYLLHILLYYNLFLQKVH